jgi:hypothetical protein
MKNKIANFSSEYKLKIYSVLYNLACNYFTDKREAKKKILNFIKRFRDKYVSLDLIRVGGVKKKWEGGGVGDGGYLIPNNLNEIKYCFSAGVGETSDFELELSEKYNIKSFIADASVNGPSVLNKNFIFLPKFIGARTYENYITLSDWMLQSIAQEKNLILQMDIEGAEYEVLSFETIETLSRFSSITVEFHGLHKLFERSFFHMFSSIFEKIYCNFSICHVHPNNAGGIFCLDEIEIPRLIEVTFIRNDLVQGLIKSGPVVLPHQLDRKNVDSQKDIKMPDLWWKK